MVRSTWFAPSEAYEVDFAPAGVHLRALLTPEQLQLEEDASLPIAASGDVLR